MKRVTVVKVNSLRGEARARVCYVGRAFAGWPASPWGNPQRVRANRPVSDSLAAFRVHMAGQPDLWFGALWDACNHGELPLGCWCFDGRSEDGQHVCHAAILGGELNRRYIDVKPAFRPNVGDMVTWNCAIGPVTAEFRGFHQSSCGAPMARLITTDDSWAEQSAPASQIAPIPA